MDESGEMKGAPRQKNALAFNRPELKKKKRTSRRSTEPIRAKGWKPPKPRPRLPLEIRIAPPEGIKELPHTNLTLLAIYRPYKAEHPHVRMRIEDCKAHKGTWFESVPVGHYILIAEPKGFRPCAWIIAMTRNLTSFHLHTPPAHRALRPQDERTLVRPGEMHPYIHHVRAFMKRFGYEAEITRHFGRQPRRERKLERTLLDGELEQMLRLFQKTWRLEVTGSLTVETVALLQSPRCAHPDYPLEEPAESDAGPPGIATDDPFVYMGNRWDQFNLRYLRLTGTGDISNEWSIINNALDRWADLSPLSFTRTTDATQSHIELDFRRPSESGYPFDRGGDKDGNTLAHAWGPLNGLVEFDDHEDWGSTSLAAVATHELGHALGLHHSSVSDATMYAWYDSGQASLHEVDVRGIKSLYAPVYSHPGPFVRYTLFGFGSEKGTDTVTIDLGQTRHFLAWGSVTMIDSLVDYDRDNWHGIDVYEVDGIRTSWRVSGGDHLGSANAPSNIYEGTRIGYGRRITFRLSAGHVSDLEVAGVAMVLVL